MRSGTGRRWACFTASARVGEVGRIDDLDATHLDALGRYPETSLAEARGAAPEILRTLAKGQTPDAHSELEWDC